MAGQPLPPKKTPNTDTAFLFQPPSEGDEFSCISKTEKQKIVQCFDEVKDLKDLLDMHATLEREHRDPWAIAAYVFAGFLTGMVVEQQLRH